MTGWIWVAVALVLVWELITLTHRYERQSYERNLKRQLRRWQKTKKKRNED